MKLKTKALVYGISAVLIVLTINFLILYALNFPLMAKNIIQTYWVLILLLIVGFGTQIGLFT